MKRHTKKALYESIMKDVNRIVKRHLIKESYDNPDVQIGDKLHIIEMKGEPQYTDAEGIVKFIDSIGQIHGTWGGCALQPENDTYEII